MINFKCPVCGKGVTAPDSAAGKMGKCSCGERLRIPAAPTPATAPVAPEVIEVLPVSAPRRSRLLPMAVGAFAILVLGIYLGSSLTQKPEASAPAAAVQAVAQPVTNASAAPTGESFTDYSVELQSKVPGVTAVFVKFRSLPPTQDEAARIVRKALEDAVAKDGSKDMLAMAFDKDDSNLSDVKYGGPLYYTAKDRQIRTEAERYGNQSTATDMGRYFAKVETNRTVPGITPERQWFTCSLVFPDTPSADEFKAAAVSQIQNLQSRGLDATVYAYTGDKGNPASWKQVQARNGKYMVVEYKRDSGSITTNFD